MGVGQAADRNIAHAPRDVTHLALALDRGVGSLGAHDAELADAFGGTRT